MYANTRFRLEVNEWGMVTKWAEPGDKISQSDLGVGDDEWQYLVDTGAVVKDYPKALVDSPQTPPAEYYRDNPEEAGVAEEAPAPAKEEVKVTSSVPQSPPVQQEEKK